MRRVEVDVPSSREEAERALRRPHDLHGSFIIDARSQSTFADKEEGLEGGQRCEGAGSDGKLIRMNISCHFSQRLLKVERAGSHAREQGSPISNHSS